MINQTYLAVIPARAGSKGIKNKNIYPINGKPLIYYTIKSALEAKISGDIVVTSDSSEILNYANNCGVKTHIRPSNLSNDNTLTYPVVVDVLEEFPKFDNVILLQPTSPLRKSEDIIKAIAKFEEFEFEALISVQKVDNKCLKNFFVKNKKLEPVVNKDFLFQRRQDLPPVYSQNGAIYIVSKESFMINQSFLTDNTGYYIMDEQSSIDVDTLDDVAYVEAYLDERK